MRIGWRVPRGAIPGLGILRDHRSHGKHVNNIDILRACRRTGSASSSPCVPCPGVSTVDARADDALVSSRARVCLVSITLTAGVVAVAVNRSTGPCAGVAYWILWAPLVAGALGGVGAYAAATRWRAAVSIAVGIGVILVTFFFAASTNAGHCPS